MNQSAQVVDSKKLIATYEAKRINEEHRLARESAESAIAHAIRCGELLIEQKPRCGHGNFQAWIGANCEFAYETAKRYMKAAIQKGTGVPFSTLSELYGNQDPEPATPQQQLQIAPEPRPAPVVAINPKPEPMTEEQRAVWSEAEAQCGRLIADYADRRTESEQIAAELTQRLPVSTETQQADRLAADVLAALKSIAESMERSPIAPRFNEHWERAMEYAHYIVDQLENLS